MAETDAMGSDSEVQYLSDESSDDEMGEGKDQQPEMTDEQLSNIACVFVHFVWFYKVENHTTNLRITFFSLDSC